MEYQGNPLFRPLADRVCNLHQLVENFKIKAVEPGTAFVGIVFPVGIPALQALVATRRREHLGRAVRQCCFLR